MIERLTPPGVPTPTSPYSPAVRAGDFVFVAGQVPFDAETNKMSTGDIQHETTIALNNIKRILEGVGASMADVVKVGVYLADSKDFAAMNAIYATYFGDSKPVRTTITCGFMADIKIEIDCIAYKPKA